MTNPNTETTQTMTEYLEIAALAANIAEAKKAVDTMVLDTGKVSHMADYFVICSGESSTQVRTIADEIEKQFRTRGQELLGKEKDGSYRWCLLDYGDIVVHVMNPEEREFYQLEKFWSHAIPVNKEKWLFKGQLMAS